MINEPNKIKWKVGNTVIHDQDEKITSFLMVILEDNRPDGLYKTQYINRMGFESFYLNHGDFLLDPMQFGINTKPTAEKKPSKQKTFD